MSSSIKIIDCPRDAMQGLSQYIPAEVKAIYLNKLLQVGFDTLDFGSFVSPKAIPQMRDTAEVLAMLDLSETETQLLAIVANERGAADACQFDEIDYLGYPFSISETFQQRNTNRSIEDSLALVENLQNLCEIHGKELVVYLSMAFGNPYGDLWDTALISHWIDRLQEIDVRIISLSDTIGIATPKLIGNVLGNILPDFNDLEMGLHLHTNLDNWRPKMEIAYKYGAKRFDGAIKGFGGCPMAKDELIGNMPTEKIIAFLEEKNVPLNINKEILQECEKFAAQIMS
ncbi:MAG: hydroxymethylglutaryl-CoA lyase [Chitinophagales bacterium]|nr:hydroxymethylglutaryl-CoA lyase [Bacteroidota bacterium]MCB9042599.1 hydroxymethylglutaryl-CoA lyase [Chitinophagales bacterium]